MQSNKVSADDVSQDLHRLARRGALKALAAFVAAPLASQPVRPEQLASALLTGSENIAERRRDQLFDNNWRFYRGAAPDAERTDFNDSAWRALDLPHDFSIEDLPPRPEETTGAGAVWGECVLPTRVGPFDSELSQGGRSTGWFVGGTSWYRKRFTTAVPANTHVEIVFDGVYMNSDVWLNGNHLGNHPYGYTGFAYDLTPHLRREGENVLAVRVPNEGRNTRWYSGSGIYRHVWLNVTEAVRVPLWGVFVTTPEVSLEVASVKVAVGVENRGTTSHDVTVRVRLLDSENANAGSREATQPVIGGGSSQIAQAFTVSAPHLWSVANPQMYRAEVDLIVGGRTVDHTVTSFGIRKIEVDAEHGLRINGEVIKLKGGCVHHDNGLLGAATIDCAEERRVKLMKTYGFNAIRTSHNPPSPRFLDACDRLGVLVIDEAFDMWEKVKSPQDYHLYFTEWWQRDIEAMVLRDRNHPSVLFWSIANEVPEWTEPRGVELQRQITEHIKRLDPTRAITAAVSWEKARDAAFHQNMDVSGYSYMWRSFEPDHERYPQRVIFGTESFPKEAFETWQLVQKLPHVIGDFVWTGIDYMGEVGIGKEQLSPQGGDSAPNFLLDYPWFNAYCGDIDLIGDKKPQMYYKDVLWGTSRLEMAVQRPVPEGRTEQITAWGWSDELRSWTWPGYEGKKLAVRVYSAGDQVRLLLNGNEVGVRAVLPEAKLKAEFEVPYAPGELKAIALVKGEEIATLAFKTVGRPAKLRLTADRKAIRSDRNDLGFITLEVLDQAGNLVPDAAIRVTFSIGGAGELAGVGSANPKDVESFRQRHARTFHGKCLVVVRPTGAPGRITVQAQSGVLTAASLVLQVV